MQSLKCNRRPVRKAQVTTGFVFAADPLQMQHVRALPCTRNYEKMHSRAREVAESPLITKRNLNP